MIRQGIIPEKVPGTKDQNHPVVLTIKSGSNNFIVELPKGSVLLYGDVLRLVYKQSKYKMDQIVMAGKLDYVYPLLLPAMEKRLLKLQKEKKNNEKAIRSIMTKLLDTWLF